MMIGYWLLIENKLPYDLNKNWNIVKRTVFKFLDKCIFYVKKTHHTYNTKGWLVSYYKVILKTGAKIKGLKEKRTCTIRIDLSIYYALFINWWRWIACLNPLFIQNDKLWNEIH